MQNIHQTIVCLQSSYNVLVLTNYLNLSKFRSCKKLYYMITVKDQNNSLFFSYPVKNLVSLLGHEFVPSTTPLLAGLSRLKIFFFSFLFHICDTYLLLIIFGSTSLE